MMADEHIGFNGRFAAALTRTVGSMWAVYFTTLFVLAWIALATFGPLHARDPYPFPFLLFIGNVVQLLLVFVILVGQQVLSRAADKRSVQTYEDAEAIFKQVVRIHDHLVTQDHVLTQGISAVKMLRHPWVTEHIVDPPPTVGDQYVGLNGRIAAWITQRVGSMWAFYIAALFQFGWIGLSMIGVISFDPYPFAFLLFLSSLTQLIFMFIIMVGQDVLGRAGDMRAQQTYLDAEAILHECARLEEYLTAQDPVIDDLCSYVAEHAPADHPIRGTVGRHASR